MTEWTPASAHRLLHHVPYGADGPLRTFDTGSAEGLTNVAPSDESFFVIEGSTLSFYR